MFKEGDKYIHFTRFGSINKGTIKHIGYVGTIDTTNSVCYNRPYMVNEKNIHYELDGTDGKFYKITTEYSEAECKQMVIAYQQLMLLKDRKRKEIMKPFKKTQTKKTNLSESSLDDIIKDKFNEDNIS